MLYAMENIPHTALIFLAGGRGTRMNSAVPKQYLPLGDKPIALHSFEYFSRSKWIMEIVVVTENEYEPFYSLEEKPLAFARPGTRRQDSVFHGLQKVSEKAEYVCIHDSARPFVQNIPFEKLFLTAMETGAAALGSKVVSTIKQCCDKQSVIKTLPRENLWSIQTPQIIRKDLLMEGYKQLKNEDVTDDVSIIERLNYPVKIVESTPLNTKITTPEDLEQARQQFTPAFI